MVLLVVLVVSAGGQVMEMGKFFLWATLGFNGASIHGCMGYAFMLKFSSCMIILHFTLMIISLTLNFLDPLWRL